jgi:hypothetical protein
MEQQQPNMMGSSMPPQNMMMSSMQRPQSGNIEQQMHAKIVSFLASQVPSKVANLLADGRPAPKNGQHTFGLANDF